MRTPVTLAASAAILVAAWHVGAGRAQDHAKHMFNAIAELAPEDLLSVPPTVVVERCSEFLGSREGQPAKAVGAALRIRGLAYLHMKRPQDALKDFQDWCKLEPKNADAKTALASALLESGHSKAALRAALEAAGPEGKSLPALVLVARVFARYGKWEDARFAIERALSIEKDYPPALYVRAMAAFYENGDGAACLKDLEACLAKCPLVGNAPETAYCLRGLALVSLQRYHEALNSYLIARRINPASLEAARGVFLAYCCLGKLHVATHAGEDLIKLAPDDPTSHTLCATVQMLLGDNDIATRLAEKALALAGPMDAGVAGDAANVFFGVGDYARASQYADTALKINAKSRPARIAKGSLLAASPESKYRNGKAALEIAKRLYDDDKQQGKREERDVCMLLAQAHAECEDFQQAIHWARKAIEAAGPQHPFRADLDEQLRLFEKGKPYRHNARKKE